MYDINVIDGGSVQVLQPLNRRAKGWLEDNVDGHAFANGVAVEMRCVRDILSAMLSDGYKITKDGKELFEGEDGDFYLR